MEVYYQVNITQSHAIFVFVLIKPAFQVLDSMTDTLFCFHFFVCIIAVCLRHTSTVQTTNLMSDNISHAFSHRVSGIPQKMQSLVYISHKL